MMGNSILDPHFEDDVYDEVMTMTDEGLSAEEIIPGLVKAICSLAKLTGDGPGAIDEAVDLLLADETGAEEDS